MTKLYYIVDTKRDILVQATIYKNTPLKPWEKIYTEKQYMKMMKHNYTNG